MPDTNLAGTPTARSIDMNKDVSSSQTPCLFSKTHDAFWLTSAVNVLRLYSMLLFVQSAILKTAEYRSSSPLTSSEAIFVISSSSESMVLLGFTYSMTVSGSLSRGNLIFSLTGIRILATLTSAFKENSILSTGLSQLNFKVSSSSSAKGLVWNFSNCWLKVCLG